MHPLIVFSEKGPFERGLQYGRVAKLAIYNNVNNFIRMISSIEEIPILRLIEDLKKNYKYLLDEDFIEEIKGISFATGLKFHYLLVYNIFREVFVPDECTVLIAMKTATKNGNNIFLKNSDKIGSEKFVGNKYFKYKEINVILIEKPENKNKIIGVSAAGSIGLKMGINEKGVVAGTNISRTLELKQKKADIVQLRALDRAKLIRDALIETNDATAAASFVIKRLMDTPMETPGNIEFVDSEKATLIEGSYDKIAVEIVTDGVIVRANHFVILKELNDPENISSFARYIRANRLLNDNKGSITVEKMIEFSQDHENGPGPNSICRHSNDFREETSLSAAVMEIKKQDPMDSKIYIALGKPCHAWRNPKGHIMLTMKTKEEEIPEGFRNGDIWKEFYIE
jgi:hypothetical protein